MTGDGPIGVVAALRAGELGDLGVHQLAHHLQPDGGRGSEEPLADVLGERGQMPVDQTGQPSPSPLVGGRDSRQPGRLGTGVVSGRGRMRTCQAGVLLETWWSPGACLTAGSERRTPTSSSTDPGTTSAHALAYVVVADRRYTDLYEWGQRGAPLADAN